MSERKGIAVAGTVLLDKINEISAYPASGELTQIKGIKYAAGGCVPNVACDIKRMRNSLDVSALGKIGKDGEGKFLIDFFKENGINTDGVVLCDDLTSFTDVMSIVGGQRTFFTYPGASSSYGIDDIDFSRLEAKILHLGYFLLLGQIKGVGKGYFALFEVKLSLDAFYKIHSIRYLS